MNAMRFYSDFTEDVYLSLARRMKSLRKRSAKISCDSSCDEGFGRLDVLRMDHLKNMKKVALWEDRLLWFFSRSHDRFDEQFYVRVNDLTEEGVSQLILDLLDSDPNEVLHRLKLNKLTG